MRPVVYILDDDEIFAKLLKANLGRAGEFSIHLFAHPQDCLDAIAEAPPSILLTDLYMDELNGVEVSRRVREQHPHLPVFVLTARGEIDTAIEAIKAGANEYLLKPVNVTELSTLIRKVIDTRPLLEEAESLRKSRKETLSVDAILGAHPLVEATRQFVRGVAAAQRVSVLLLGESGVGKNLAAHAIHQADPSAKGRFVELNCAALPPALLEAELFGYVKGAFTDAKANKPGLVEAAAGGTLFLDEIGEMPPELQSKLLNFLESRRFRRLGGTREMEVDLRVLTATNRPVEELREGKGFRSDLFYRVSVASHRLPALREIASDIPTLAAHFVRTIAAQQGRHVDGISEQASEALKGYGWPGNARELRNAVERAVIFAKGPELGRRDFPILDGPAEGGTPKGRFGIPSGLTLKEAEREYIRLTLEASDATVQDVAKGLGISRKNLWERKKRLGLSD